ncbi:MAG TPA: globin [Chloroflexota bacterium]|nr:globin [Chloroflexota bacterium]
MAERMTIYEAVGGAPTFERLVNTFYGSVEKDPLLRPLYPEDLSGPRRHLTLFLIQFFGGPSTYSEERGHPALRMRHMPFTIGREERDAWMRHMMAALDKLELSELVQEQFRGYFDGAATFLMNQPEGTGSPGSTSA